MLGPLTDVRTVELDGRHPVRDHHGFDEETLFTFAYQREDRELLDVIREADVLLIASLLITGCVGTREKCYRSSRRDCR